MSNRYSFTTTWEVDAPVGRVWEAIAHPLAWPGWWRGVEAVEELEAGDPDGIGALHRYTWKSALPYRLSFDMRVTAMDEPRRLQGEASGELEGEGEWTFTPLANGATVVHYRWDVATTRRWMALFAPLLRPAFEWNHDYVMRSGGRCLGELLGVTVREPARTSGRRGRTTAAAIVAGLAAVAAFAAIRSRRHAAIGAPR